MRESLDWDRCQERADELLAQGVWLVQSKPVQAHNDVGLPCCGNYLISIDRQPQYIGEAGNLRARLRQQFTAKLSTFHKNYSKHNPGVEISRFVVQAMKTSIGRKEIEEFGITIIPCGEMEKQNTCMMPKSRQSPISYVPFIARLCR